ncbi:MAG: hypothetical protein N0E54_18855 [Candidatus Thiodiazotropha taylori]|nr:hypothetical protein [Candidatus Thiodiazotropha endolucinida]MCW4230809.1 hypothetical protein [Candidatus Thiodiazotropha taylori]
MTDQTDIITSRLDGYLDALSLMIGKFREYRYFSYLVDIKESELEESLSLLYQRHKGEVTFERLINVSPWLKFIQTNIEERLKTIVSGDNDRIYQAAWYIVEMIEQLNNYETPESIYTCSYKYSCDGKCSIGTLYVVPVKNQQLIINMLRENSA